MGHNEIAETLVRAGSDVNVADKVGRFAMRVRCLATVLRVRATSITPCAASRALVRFYDI
jgi:hypothetical protein